MMIGSRSKRKRDGDKSSKRIDMKLEKRSNKKRDSLYHLALEENKIPQANPHKIHHIKAIKVLTLMFLIGINCMIVLRSLSTVFWELLMKIS